MVISNYYLHTNLPGYRAEVLFKYSRPDAEDHLEEKLREFMEENKMYIQGGPLVFRVGS